MLCSEIARVTSSKWMWCHVQENYSCEKIPSGNETAYPTLREIEL